LNGFGSIASNQIARFLAGPDHRPALRQTQQLVKPPAEGNRLYFDYILRFLLLYEHLCSLTPPGLFSVKGTDQMLWAG
jgi:hypothetical protein